MLSHNLVRYLELSLCLEVINEFSVESLDNLLDRFDDLYYELTVDEKVYLMKLREKTERDSDLSE